MKNNIPLDGTNVNDATAEKDAMSLLIMRQAFLDATSDTENENEITDEITDSTVKDLKE